MPDMKANRNRLQGESAKRLKEGERLTAYTALATIGLFIIKFVAGILSGSLSLMGDSFDSFSDIFVISASWFGLRISQRSPDERFPYGYYRVETFVSLLVSIFIVFIGVELFRESIMQILEPVGLRLPLLALITAAGSAVISFVIFFFLDRVGKRIDSEILMTNAKERKTDILKSSLVFLSLIFSYAGFLYAGGIAGIIFSIVILRIGILSAKDASLLMLDAWTDPEVQETIRALVSKVEGVKEIKEIKLRKSGSFVFGEATIGVSGILDVKRAHEITDRIEKRLEEEISSLGAFTVHVEPAKARKIRIGISIGENRGLESRISEYFGEAPHYAIVDIEKDQIMGYFIRDNPYMGKESKAALRLSNLLIKERINVLVSRQIEEISFHTLRDHFVEIYTAKGDTVEDALKLFLQDALERMEGHIEE
ncbi:MAG: cation diffusion facilitator family transporter [Candidatus Hodarchaeota archaeon]